MQFITEHWEEIVTVVVSLHAIALVVVNLTPTPKDNELLSKAYRLVELVAGLVSPKAKQSGKESVK